MNAGATHVEAPDHQEVRPLSGVSPVWRGQLFLFEKSSSATYSSRQGTKLLIVSVLLEAVRMLLKTGAERLGILHRLWWMGAEMMLLMLLACVLVTRFAGVPLSDIGLRGWSRWSRTEKHSSRRYWRSQWWCFSLPRLQG
jgi:hypothetical protein